MSRRWIFCCFLLVLYCAARSQTSTPVIPFEALFHAKYPVIINWRDNALPFSDTPFNRFPQEILKTTNGLYLFVNGSGRLYQLTGSETGIQAKRIDSTFYSGYNFGSFPFVYHDSIYTLGGYGIWRINGQLRVYVPQAHSWDIVPLNKEIPVLMQEDYHNMLWYNEQTAKLYIGYSMIRNQAVKHTTLNEASFDYTVYYLDLKTKNWHVAGALNNYFKDKVALLRNIAFTPWGQLVSFGDKLLIIDYVNNRLLHIQEAAEHAIRPVLFHNPNTNLYYCVDSTLYFGNIAENRLSSLQLHSSDFADAGITVYTPPLSPVLIFIEWIAGALVLLVAIFFIWQKRKQAAATRYSAKFTTNTPDDIPDQVFTMPTNKEGITAKSSMPFDERELQVIQLIISNNRQSLPTTIDDLNAVLGLSKKSNDAQKNHRSMVLKSINTKFGVWQNTSEKLIESKKAETDKRTFTYTIDRDKEVIITKLLSLVT